MPSPYLKPDLSRRVDQRVTARPASGISGWVIGVGLAWVGAAVVVRSVWVLESPSDFGFAAARLMAGLFVCFLIAALIGMLSRVAGNIFFLLLTAVLGVVSVAKVYLQRQDAERASPTEVPEGRLVDEPAPPILQRSSGPSVVEEIAVETAAAYADRVARAVATYERAARDARAAKAFDPEQLLGRLAIIAARERLRTFARANEALIDVTENYESILRAELKVRGMRPADIEALLSDNRGRGSEDLSARKKRVFSLLSRAEDQKMIKASGEILDLMLEHEGRWKVRRGRLRFRSRAAQRRYRRLRRAVDDAVDRRAALKKRGS